MAQWIHDAEVTGKGFFPTDMLRYDRCFPVDQGDVSRIDATGEERTITVRTFRETKRYAFTTQRWASFGWACDVKDPRRL